MNIVTLSFGMQEQVTIQNKKILDKYPKRAFYTAERSDLYQVLKHSRFYLRTYPICGGLMYQYAASAGKVPVTLRFDECADGFLLNQKDLNIEFSDINLLFEEIDKLLCNDGYCKQKEELMTKAVISKKEFEDTLCDILNGKNGVNIKISNFDTNKFRGEYIKKMSTADIDMLLINKEIIKTGIKYMPGQILREDKKKYGKNLYDISIIVCTYNAIMTSLLLTLDSIINQKGVNYEVIIADDGSENNLRDEIINYFNKRAICNWTLICNEKNQGTVQNIKSAIDESNGKYIKLISPGDVLSNDKILKMWMNFMIEKNVKWSFSDYSAYIGHPSDKKYISIKANPMDIVPYLKDDEKKCRWNYVVLNDIALGAAIFSESGIMKEYLLKIVGRVMYAEDNIWRMMMFDGIVGAYFQQNTIVYEYGTGISTKGSEIWSKRLLKDWNEANNIMLQNKQLDEFQTDIVNAWAINGKKNKFRKLFIKGNFKHYIEKKIRKRKTKI